MRAIMGCARRKRELWGGSCVGSVKIGERGILRRCGKRGKKDGGKKRKRIGFMHWLL